MEKKTMMTIKEYKSTACNVFGNWFNYTLETLFDWYVAKLDGEERIKKFLNEWDEKAQKYWLKFLNKRIKESGLDDIIEYNF